MPTNDLAGVHVLVAEDTDDSRAMLKVVLVTDAASVAEARRILGARVFL